MQEVWLPVVGWEGLYEVSNWGRVKSLARLDSSGRRTKERIMKPLRCPYGYWRLQLCRNGKTRMFTVHSLVAAAFLGPRPEGLDVLHGTGGKQNNRLENLSYGTASQNLGADRVRDGTSNRGERCGAAKLVTNDVLEIRWLVALGAHRKAVATEYRISVATVYDIIAGRTWAWLDAA